jgi:glycosyltransferase involved in cell wall biosynthesis
MAEKTVKDRKKIGLLFTGSYNWTGGLYYILNIIRALDRLPDPEKPFLVIFYNRETPGELLKEINYPYSSLHDLDDAGFFRKGYSKLLRIFTGRNHRVEQAVNPYRLETLYPMSEYFSDLRGLNCRVVHWLYDFQHKFLPQFFSKDELGKRERTFQRVAEHARTIVVSSYDAAGHFRKFYPASTAKLKVLRFVSITENYRFTPVAELRKKYGINGDFFLVANQFWQHKNHMDVLKAMVIGKNRGKKLNVVFTGKQHDHRNPDYFNSIREFVNKEGLTVQAHFTGFISREDQLGLMQECMAVVQPSRFEGWSTVLEDAKALGQQVIASDLPVHVEQLGEAARFFTPGDPERLLALMETTVKRNALLPDRTAAITGFANDFLQAMHA